MVTKHSLACFDEFTARFIRAKVGKLIGKAGFTKSDRPDLVQTFVLDLLQRQKDFDPDVATWEAFVVVVCENCYATILEHAQAEMRAPEREEASLDQLLKDGDGNLVGLGSTLPESQAAKRTGRFPRSEGDIGDLQDDVAAVLAGMPPTMREICEIVMRKSKFAAARELGMSQGALYELLGRIRTRFDEAGLRGYFE